MVTTATMGCEANIVVTDGGRCRILVVSDLGRHFLHAPSALVGTSTLDARMAVLLSYAGKEGSTHETY